MMGKTGVIDVGGGFRGIYAAGVLDYCLDNGIRFDLGIGISAGSANMASFAAGQRGRNLRFYTEFGMRSEYASMHNYLHHHTYVALDYVYTTLSRANGESPLDYPALRDNPMDMIVVATDANTGEPHYFTKADLAQDRYDIFKASSAIPTICKPYPVNGVPYFDGALGDPIPVEKAMEWGCDRVVVILTKPEHVLRNARKDTFLARGIRRRYPEAAKKLCGRAELYNNEVALAQSYARQGQVLIVSPDDTCGVDTLTREHDRLMQLYDKGYRDAQRIKAFMRGSDQ